MAFPQLQSFAAGVKTALGGFFQRMAEAAGKLCVRLEIIADRLLERVAPRNRRLVIIAAMGTLAVLILILIGTAFFANSGREPLAVTAVPAGESRQTLIPPDELFLPDEPDFVPGVLLERERRGEWTADDAKPWWQDPLKDGEDPWRNLIEQTVDEIMEKIP